MKIKNLLATTFVALATVCTLLTGFISSPASAAFSSADCPNGSLFKTNPSKAKSAGDIKTLADCNIAKDDRDLMVSATTIINVVIGVVGVIAIAVIVIGGILYVTSAGDATKAKRAQHAIMYALVGLIIAILAFAIVNFILANIF